MHHDEGSPCDTARAASGIPNAVASPHDACTSPGRCLPCAWPVTRGTLTRSEGLPRDAGTSKPGNTSLGIKLGSPHQQPVCVAPVQCPGTPQVTYSKYPCRGYNSCHPFGEGNFDGIEVRIRARQALIVTFHAGADTSFGFSACFRFV